MEFLSIYIALFWFIVAIILILWQAWRFNAVNNLPTQVKLIEDSKLPALSLIIACKNEARNLAENLERWLALDYPNWELLLVNDQSEDHSLSLMQGIAHKKKDIQILDRPKEANPGKKAALKEAIEKAKNDCLVFCDADCRPNSENWLRYAGTHFAEGSDIVLGYGKLEGDSLFQGLVDFETTRTAYSYWHYALRGNAFMGVGRNLGYRKKLYEKVNGFEAHQDLASGDDDLFIHSAAQGAKISLMTAEESMTISPAVPNYTKWLFQKGRHYSTAWRYKWQFQLSLGLEGALILAFWLTIPFALVEFTLPALALFFSRMGIQLSISSRPYLFSQVKWNVIWPVWEIIATLSTFALHLRNLLFGPPKKW